MWSGLLTCLQAIGISPTINRPQADRAVARDERFACRSAPARLFFLCSARTFQPRIRMTPIPPRTQSMPAAGSPYCSGEFQELSRVAVMPHIASEIGESFYLPRLFQVHAKLMHACGQTGEATEASLKTILGARDCEGAKVLELRAAIGLVDLWRRQGKCKEGRLLLSPICDWFYRRMRHARIQRKQECCLMILVVRERFVARIQVGDNLAPNGRSNCHEQCRSTEAKRTEP